MKTQHNWMHRLLMITVLLLVCTTAFVSCDGEDTPPAHEHTVAVDAAVAATCKTTGLTEGAHCSECGEILVAQETVSITDHTPVIDAAVAATCTTTGLTEGSHCSVCGEVFVAQQTIANNNHTAVIDEAVAADCQNTGLTSGIHCSTCGEILVKQEVTPVSSQHTYDDRYDAVCNLCGHTREVGCAHLVIERLPAKDTTCNEFGLTEGIKCVTCGETIVAQEIIEKKPHTDGEWVTDKEPTATETGTKRRVCAVCGETLREVTIPVLGALEYTINSDGTSCTVTGIGSFMDADLYIPEYIDGYMVTAIGQNAFADQTQLTAIIIPDTITKIGARAFYGCTGLTEITIPESVTSIGVQIFNNASNLTTVYYNSTYGDRNNKFLNLTHITKIVFGGKKVPDDILYIHNNIKEVVILDGVTSIGTYAFRNCDNLTSIVIPNSVTSIGTYAFWGCDSLTNVVIPDNVTSIDAWAFRECHNLTSVVISDSVTSIDSYAFYYCTSLTSITFTGTVEQWDNISKGENWRDNVPANEVTCSDGTAYI